MGVHPNIGFNRFPKQGLLLYKFVSVCFEYNTKQRIPGIVIRDDIEEPYLAIIHLFDGRTVLTTECQYSLTGEV